jgi:hypothetical protein
MRKKSKNNTLFNKKIKSSQRKSLKKLILSARFANIYLVVSLLVLTLSIVFWSFLSAKVQSVNQGQSVFVQLMANFQTFHHAILSSQQTFILKWPVYLVISLFGASSAGIIGGTIFIVLLTVGLLVGILRQIEKRPLYLGTILLGLASVLMLIPAEPKLGVLMPANMAMLATRNIEYLVFIYALINLIKSPHAQSKKFWLSVGLMSLVIASDKFFLIISGIGAVLAMIYYGLRNKSVQDNLVTKWLLVTIGGFVGSLLLFWLINVSRLTTIVGQTAGSFSSTITAHRLASALHYMFSSALTNLGANPRLFRFTNSPIGPMNAASGIGLVGYILNFLILALGVLVIFLGVKNSPSTVNQKKINAKSVFSVLGVIISWTTLAALLVFIFTSHNVKLDVSYLTILLFAVFVSITNFSVRKNLQPEYLVTIGAILLIGILLSIMPLVRQYRADQQASLSFRNQNSTIIAALKQHPVKVLVGDYRTVIPIAESDKSLNKIMPLNGCTKQLSVNTSKLWQTNLNNQSFAYILITKPDISNSPTCSLSQIRQIYGYPNSSVLISGTLSNPREILIFFDHGIRKHKQVSSPTVTLTPYQLSSLPLINCAKPTLMTIVAHQDDDLLFMNPNLTNFLKTGDCDRAIYLTAGDDGQGEDYWIGRQLGSEAAYDTMLGLGLNQIWLQKNIEIANQEYVSIAHPSSNQNISLIFFGLPDGNLNGQGFPSTKFESLAKLYSGAIPSIESVDKQSTYSLSGLVSALTALMAYYRPTEIWTQSSFYTSGDHSDHITTGKIATKAYNSYETNQYQNIVQIPIKYYVGYPIRSLPINVSPANVAFKATVFSNYAKHDSNICNAQSCPNLLPYSGYYYRQYTEPY